ncbi:hypothetical protein RUM44_011983 [Polyplax serrata]|uniref:U4/U6.U5 tri-snRNP-associated protein 1 n=1 Tax=Polyplax serrata TaxID=468196 RepID=A0ABR1BAD8_POLSC
MGSTGKKHKSDKKKKRSKSPERREKHKAHKRHHRERKRKAEYIETEDLVSSSSNSDVEEIHAPPPPKISKTSGLSSPGSKPAKDLAPPPPVISDTVAASDGKSHESLSIEETNKLRAKLGLKPLKVSSKDEKHMVSDKPADQAGGGEFVHKPASNISEKIKGEKIRERLAERKEKREIERKLRDVKGLGDDSDSDNDVKDWVKKSRQKELERKQAEAREKLLQELDQEFGVESLVEEEKRDLKRNAYTARDLRGLKVGHSVSGFKDDSSVILTLEDKAVLEEGDDVLVNVNMVENERYKKNNEIKKKSAKYDDLDKLDDPDVERSVLSKYDEEIEGPKKDGGFRLGEESSQLEEASRKLAIRNKLLQQGEYVSLNTSVLKMATDYYTEEELSLKFKKTKVKAKKLRKKPKMLKAEDLLPIQDVSWPSEDLGTRRPKQEISRHENIPMDIVKTEPLGDPMDVDDVPAATDDLADIKIEPDEGELELQLALSKARKLKLKEKKENIRETIVRGIMENTNSQNPDGPGGTIILNSTAEFCRTLGDIPTYGLSGNREEEEQELLDFEREVKEEKRRHDEKKNVGAWNEVELEDNSNELLPKEVPILDAEPDVGSGVAGALRLALSKGYLEKETENRPSASRFAHLQAQNYSIEDKSHGDDDKFGRRDRYIGPTTDFKEKDNYKPNVKLDYIDDEGHILNAKEAFRYLSHKFHGKGPGKNKVEKRMKKNEQEGLMKQMSSTDTPLRTLTMLQQKQKETQSPYVVLSGNKQLHSTTISKTKH